MACRYQADEIPPEELPMLAAELLAEGVDTPTLCELAGLSRRADVRDIRDTFEQAVREAGIGFPGRVLARRHAMRRIAARLVDGEIAALDPAADDWEDTETETAEERAFTALLPPCTCCLAHTLDTDQRTWEARLRRAALALIAAPPTGPCCRPAPCAKQ
ncbi:hypothetical protein SLA_7322 [Streptomyces laurentii]|uniref:Uncharacterized protein n=2 Tax=Streptomyces laurentii TaxID=39478 RepID=A0A169PM92_STRLU|nr:hypothetical protein SLA_7322 [Streptomyces laurentii]